MDTHTPSPGVPLTIAARLNRLPVTRRHKKIIAIIALGNFFEIYELFLAGVLAATLKTKFALTGFDLSLVLASAFVGAFVGAVLIGRIADRLGRRRAYMITLGLYSVFTLLAAFSTDLWMLVLCRFIAGVGLGGELPVTDSFLGDILPSKRRGYFVAWAFTLSYTAVPVVGFVGMIVVDASPLGIDGWRWMFALGALGALITFVLRRHLPESPRWLESVGRTDEAEAVTRELEDAARTEGWAAPAEDEAISPVSTGPVSASAMLRKPLLRRTITMAIVWILAVVGYHGFSSVATLVLTGKGISVTNSLLYVSLAFVGYPVGSLLSMLVMDRFERKWLLGGSLVAMAALGLAYGNAVTPVWIVLWGFTFTVIANLMSNVTHVYQLEQYPTAIRTTATGRLYSLGRLSTAAAPLYLIPMLEHSGAGAVFTLVAAALAVAAVVTVGFGVATTGRTLEEISPGDAPTAVIPQRARTAP